MIINCRLDPERLAPLLECTQTYEMEGTEDAEWPWNILSRRTQAYSCGALRRGEDLGVHSHDEAEFALCRRLADEANALLEGVPVGMGSEADAGFGPFFIVASVGAENPQALNADIIRVAFGGTVYPEAEIVVEPLEEQANWWSEVMADCEAEGEDTSPQTEECLRPFRSLVEWFRTQAVFQETAFVSVSDLEPDDENGGCVLPRLFIGLTTAGSIVGVAGYVVHT